MSYKKLYYDAQHVRVSAIFQTILCKESNKKSHDISPLRIISAAALQVSQDRWIYSLYILIAQFWCSCYLHPRIKRKLISGGIPYTAHGAQILNPPFFSFILFYAYFRLV